MTAPAFLLPGPGQHNDAIQESLARLSRSGCYRNLATVCVTPTRGMIPARVVQSWLALQTPMNQKFYRMMMTGMEVGVAYEEAVDFVIRTQDFNDYQYLLTLEEDNLPPPDGVLKLFEGVEAGYDVVGGLYWTKGEGGMPMCYGDPNVLPLNFIPQMPMPGVCKRCNGLGMGFTLFKLSLFREGRIPRPWFKTLQQFNPQVGTEACTQDLYFFGQAAKYGYRFACHAGCLVGHYDAQRDVIW